jgi:predicted nucleic acid-binding protein
MIVVDTNILAYQLLAQADPTMRGVAARLLAKERILLPVLWRHEFLNVLAGYAKARLLSLEDAEGAWYQAVSMAQHVEAEVDMMRALELSQECGISAYDAQFVALAEGANTVLITEDKRLRHAVGKRAVGMKEYLAAR